MNTNPAALVVPPPSPVSTNEGLRDIKAPVDIPNTWAWVWWSVSAEVPAYSQMGNTSFQVRDGEYTNGEYWTGDLTPWSGCNN